MSKIEWFHSGTLMEARLDGEVVGFIKEFNDMHSVYIGETEKRIGSFHRYKNAQAALEKAVASHVPEPQDEQNNKGKFIALKRTSRHQLAKRIRELKRLDV